MKGNVDGYLVREKQYLHYVYVRLSARGRGVARALIGLAFSEGVPVRYTACARDIDKRRLPKHWEDGFYDLMVNR